MNEQEDAASRFATITAEVEHTRGSLASIDKRMEDLEKESRESFNRVYDKLDKATAPRPTPWNLILTGIGVLVAMFTAMMGAGLTAALALAAWANAYFGQSINKVDLKVEQGIQMHAAISTSLSELRSQVASNTAEIGNSIKDRERINLKLDEISRRAENQREHHTTTPP